MSLRQVSSDPANTAILSNNGLRFAIPSAHAFEPQHGRISFTASSSESRFQRASTSLCRPTVRAQPFQKFCHEIANHRRPISHRRSNIVDGPNFRDSDLLRQK
jgi:hypothetical protein